MSIEDLKKNTPHGGNEPIDLKSPYENAPPIDSLDKPMEAEATFFYCVLIEAALIICVFFFSKWIIEWLNDYSPAGQIAFNLLVFALGFLIGFTAFRIYILRFSNESKMLSSGSGFISNYESRSRGNPVLINCLFATVAGTINVILLHIAFNFLM